MLYILHIHISDYFSLQDQLKGQCVGIEAIYVQVNITSLQTMHNNIFGT